MLSENDVRALKGWSDGQHRFVLTALLGLIAMQVFGIYHNLTLAISYGEALGLDLMGILGMWNAEPDLQKHYLGYEVQSLHRLNMTILNIGGALLFGIWTIQFSLSHSRDKRILGELKRCGAI